MSIVKAAILMTSLRQALSAACEPGDPYASAGAVDADVPDLNNEPAGCSEHPQTAEPRLGPW